MVEFVKALKRMRRIGADPGTTEVELLEATLAERDRENPGWDAQARAAECVAALQRGIEPELLREIYGAALTDRVMAQVLASARGSAVGAGSAERPAAETGNQPLDAPAAEQILAAIAGLDGRVTEIAARVQELTATVGRLAGLLELRGADAPALTARRPVTSIDRDLIARLEERLRRQGPGGSTAAEAVAEDLALGQFLLTKVDALELSVRSAAVLKQANIVYIGDLVQMTEADLLRRPNSGRRSVNEIKEVLALMGLHLGMEVPDWPPAELDELARRLEDH
jgi:hypothetical protein